MASMANMTEGSASSCTLSYINSEVFVSSWVRGCHDYKDAWKNRSQIGEVMELQHEPRNQHDKNAVAVMKNGEIFGHIPRALASTKQGTGTVCQFLNPIMAGGAQSARGKLKMLYLSENK